MTYAHGHPVRPVGGRLALDFVNTADWSEDGRVTHEKVATRADLRVWLEALDLGAVRCAEDIEQVRRFRAEVRRAILGGDACGALVAAARLDLDAARIAPTITVDQPLEALVAMSAISVLSDRRERARLKMCPGKDCGWLFIDETKNARRRWCMMETCGNRAKAARHYARRTTERDAEG